MRNVSGGMRSFVIFISLIFILFCSYASEASIQYRVTDQAGKEINPWTSTGKNSGSFNIDLKDELGINGPVSSGSILCQQTNPKSFKLIVSVRQSEGGSCSKDTHENGEEAINWKKREQDFTISYPFDYDDSENLCSCFPTSGGSGETNWLDNSEAKCCGDDLTDFGSGTGDYMCVGSPSGSRWENYNVERGNSFEVSDGSYSYRVLAGQDGWYACDIENNFDNFYHPYMAERDSYIIYLVDSFYYSNKIREAGIKTVQGNDYLCSYTDSDYLINEDTLEIMINNSNSVEAWEKCDTRGEFISVIDDSGNQKVYFCGEDNTWTTDLDKDSDGTSITQLSSGACDASFAMVEDDIYLDFDNTMTKCCGDDYIEQGVFEYYSDLSETLIADNLNNHVGGCWNGRKIKHGQLLDEIIGEYSSGDDYTYSLVLNPNLAGTTGDIKFWILNPSTIEKSGGNIILENGDSISTKYALSLTPGLEYEMKIHAESATGTSDRMRISSDYFDEDILVNFTNNGNVDDGTSVGSPAYSFNFKPSDRKHKITISSDAGIIYLKKIELRPVGSKILNANGQFHICQENDFASEKDYLINDDVCKGYDFSDVSRGEYFCFDGEYVSENMDIDLNSNVDPVFENGVISERTLHGYSFNLFDNSGFELNSLGDYVGECIISDDNTGGFDDVMTSAFDRPSANIITHDYPGTISQEDDDLWTKYLQCGSGSTGTRTLSLEAGTYIMSAWVQGQGDICVSSGNTCYSSQKNSGNPFDHSDWQRIYFQFSVTSDSEVDVRFEGDGDIARFDNVQIETAEVYNGIQQSEPSTYYYVERRDGCCTPDRCWTGSYCINETESGIKFTGDLGKTCVDGTWGYGSKKLDWTDDPKRAGFCDSDSECFNGDTGECVSSGDGYQNYICESGIWTSKAKYISGILMHLAGPNNFELACGPYDEVMNNYTYLVARLNVEKNLLRYYTGANTYVSRVNDFCVIHYNEKTIFGIALNGTHINSEDYYNNGFSRIFSDNINFCSNVVDDNILLKANPGFYECRPGSSIGNVYYDPFSQVAIFSKDPLTITSDSYDIEYDSNPNPFYNLVNNYIHTPYNEVMNNILNRPQTPFWIAETQYEFDLSLFTRFSLFDKVYVNKRSDDRTIFAAMEPKYSRESNEKRNIFMMEIDGYGDMIGDVCSSFRNFESSNYPGRVVAGTNCTRLGDDYILIAEDRFNNPQGRAFDSWTDFTGKLRVN
ncbi:MAG: hypothetical protein ACLFPQ_01050 [Candidatus Woesearchaeota archaeon]